jgi:hypothetical protein
MHALLVEGLRTMPTPPFATIYELLSDRHWFVEIRTGAVTLRQSW